MSLQKENMHWRIFDDKWVLFREARLDEIIQLRHDVLIVHTDRDSPYFEGDEEETTMHFGAFEEKEIIACLTFLQRPWDHEPAWQLRGMATRPRWRGWGIGRELLIYAEETIRMRSDIIRLWCDARIPAVAFYEKQGWRVMSERFEIKGVGPHVKMSKLL